MNLVTVVGAGPIGLQIANNLKKEGFEVNAIEEHGVIGRPTNCAGLVSRTGLKELGIRFEDSIVNEIKGAKIFGPEGEKIEVKRKEIVAYVLDRFKFDQLFYKEAKKIGLNLKTNTKLLDIRGNTLFLESNGRGELMKSDIVVGADGTSSTVRHIAGKEISKEFFVHSLQGKADGNFDKRLVEIHFGKFAPGFFAWIIPESETKARIGLGATAGQNIDELFKRFLIEKEIQASVYQKNSALIPIGPPLKPMLSEKIFLAGDAAFQTKATTGGGIVTGLEAANSCSKTIANHLKHGSPLTDYEKNLAPITKELNMHWKIRSYINKLSNQKISSLFMKAKQAGIEEFLEAEGDMDKPSRFIGKLAKKPRFWFLLPQLMKILRG